MRKYWLNLHLYGGLLCSAYLLIFGYTSLQFNHKFSFAAPGTKSVTWEKSIALEPITNNLASAERIRDQLGLMGWPLPWKMSRDAAGNLEFDMERPGKSYTIHARVSEGRVRVEERRKGFWPVVNSLHALMEVPNARFVSGWGFYTEVCTWVVLLAAGSGVYLWASSGRERKVALATLIAAVGASAGFMLFVILRG